MESEDWLSALTMVHDRLDALERYSRMHATAIAQQDDEQKQTREAIRGFSNDFESYKKFITEPHKRIDSHVKTNVNHIQSQIDAIVQVTVPNIDVLNQRVKNIEEALAQRQPSALGASGISGDGSSAAQPSQSMTGGMFSEIPPSRPQAQQNQTQPNEPATSPVPAYAREDPRFTAAQTMPSRRTMAEESTPRTPVQHNIASPPDAPHASSAQGGVPNMPPSFGNGPRKPDSPFHGSYGPSQAGMGWFPGNSAWAGGKPSVFEVSRKKNDLLFTFTQKPEDYKLWHDRMVDHFCRSTQRYRQLLEYVETTLAPLRREFLLGTNVDGINAWDISTMVEAFLVDWFPRNMYNRRKQLSGGEQGNGLEMWRRLYTQYQGGADAVEYGGIQRLQEFPRYPSKDLSRLSDHMDDWLDVLSQYGHELEHCPRMLRAMALKLLPRELEDEAMEKSAVLGLFTYNDVIEWARNKTTLLRQKELSELHRKPVISHIKGLKHEEPEEPVPVPPPPPAPHEEHVPAWAQEFVAALRAQKPPGQRRPRDEQRRAASPRGDKKKFIFIGCWHCKSDKHSRRNCPEFLDILKKANPGVVKREDMKLPANYEGAYEKARKAAGLSVKKRVNMLGEDEFHDSDSEDEGPAIFGRLCALGCPDMNNFNSPIPQAMNDEELSALNVRRMQEDEIDPDRPMPTNWSQLHEAPPASIPSTKNRYSALSSTTTTEDDVTGDEEIEGWSVKVSRTNAKKQKRDLQGRHLDVFDQVTIRNERDLEKLLARNPRIAALPETEKKFKKLLKSKPLELMCGPDEVLCLVDSGSTVNAAWIAKHFPAYAALVKQTDASRRGDSATTACGKRLVNKGRCVVSGKVGDDSIPVAFKDMEVEMPILSVRKMVKHDHEVKFHSKGGYIKNRSTKKTIPFYEYEGVYFLKMKIEDPATLGVLQPDIGGDSKIPSGFARPGR